MKRFLFTTLLLAGVCAGALNARATEYKRDWQTAGTSSITMPMGAHKTQVTGFNLPRVTSYQVEWFVSYDGVNWTHVKTSSLGITLAWGTLEIDWDGYRFQVTGDDYLYNLDDHKIYVAADVYKSGAFDKEHIWVIQGQALVDAYWLMPLDVSDGDLVTMRVETVGIPIGAYCSFEIYEDDGLFADDKVDGTFYGRVYQAGDGKTYADTTWVAEWQSDQWGDPEFYFKASYGDMEITSSKEDNKELIVRKNRQTPSTQHGDFYYSTGAATAKAALTDDRIPLILIHGASGDSKTNSLNYWYGWANGDMSPANAQLGRLNQSGMSSKFRVYRFVYDSRRPISANGTEFAQFVNNFCANNPAFAERQVVIMAHSMGGLVSRYALNTNPDFRARVHRLITLGTPHLGSPLANPSWVKQADTSGIIENIVSSFYHSNFGGTEGDFDLAWYKATDLPLSARYGYSDYQWVVDKGYFVKTLLDNSLTAPFTGSGPMMATTADPKIIAYSGSFSSEVSGEGENWPDAVKSDVTQVTKSDHYGLYVLKNVLGDMTYASGVAVGANDGMVSVNSAQLAGHPLAENIHFNPGVEPVDHASYLDAPSTMDYVAQRLLTMAKVTISPANAVNAGARWRIAGGAWQKSGVSLNALKPGTYTIEFKEVAGWVKPANRTITVNNNETTTLSGSNATYSLAPAISVTPASLSFGSVEVGASKDLSFTVQNTGGSTLVGNATVSAPFSVVSGASYSIAANGSHTVTIRYTPTAAGQHTGSVSFTGGSGITRSVNGSAIQPAVIEVTPDSLDFGIIEVGASAELTFTVSNAGEALLFGGASASPPFFIVSGSSYSLGAGGSQSVVVRYSPQTAEPHQGGVTFAGGNATIKMVTGRGVRSVGLSADSLVENGQGIAISWPSEPDRRYTLLCSSNLLEGFYIRATNIAGDVSSTTFWDDFEDHDQLYWRIVEEE